jgi:CBS domain-containing protein
MQVAEIMSRSLRSVTPETKLLEVASLMCLYRFSGLPVVEGDQLVGIIAEKDVLHRLFPTLEDLIGEGMGSVDLDQMMGQYKQVMALTVADVMARNPITVAPDMHILRAATVMARNKFRRIPVADGGKLVGMVSLGDIHKAIFQANITTNLSIG